MKDTMTNANFPIDAEGRTYHVGTKVGEVANRILTVGDPARAHQIGALLDGGKPLFEHTSHRGFVTLTGTFGGVPVSIVAIMMGTPNMDFFVRETRAVVHGPMCIIRLGSCGGIGDGSVGDVAVADSAVAISRNFDAFTADAAAAAEPPYLISKPVAADAGLTASLKANIEAAIAHQAGALDSKVVVGLNATADSFYSSQGRTDTAFDDRNEALFDAIRAKYPAAQTLEMETFMLYHLAQCATPVAVSVEGTAGAPQLAVAKSTSYMITPTPSIPSSGDTTPELRPAAEPAAAAITENTAATSTSTSTSTSKFTSSIKASAAMIIFAGRKSNAFITPDRVALLQEATGRAVLKTLAEAVL